MSVPTYSGTEICCQTSNKDVSASHIASRTWYCISYPGQSWIFQLDVWSLGSLCRSTLPQPRLVGTAEPMFDTELEASYPGISLLGKITSESSTCRFNILVAVLLMQQMQFTCCTIHSRRIRQLRCDAMLLNWIFLSNENAQLSVKRCFIQSTDSSPYTTCQTWRASSQRPSQ